MARIRTIKPQLFTDDDLAELTLAARFLFVGLFCLADRRGRLEDRPRKIKAEVFPYDTVDVDSLLWELAEHRERFIIRYEAESRRYLQVRNFEKHQHCHVREPDSTIPAPDEHQSCTVPPPDEPQSGRVGREGKGREGNNKTPASDDAAAGFDEFWQAYPRHVNKAQALKAWKKKRINGQLPEILAALEVQKRSPQWTKDGGQFVPHAATWINNERWTDEGTGTRDVYAFLKEVQHHEERAEHAHDEGGDIPAVHEQTQSGLPRWEDDGGGYDEDLLEDVEPDF